MGEHMFQLAILKIEIVMLTCRRVPTIIDINIDDGGNPHAILTKLYVKYLKVLLDNKLSFQEHF